MAVQDIVMMFVSRAISWLSFTVVLLLIYKFVVFIMSLFGKGGDWSWPGSDRRDKKDKSSNSDKSNKKSKKEKEKDKEYDEKSKELDESNEPGKFGGPLDWENPGYFQVYVTDRHGTPLNKVEVTVKPVKPRKIKTAWYKRNKEWERSGRTNNDGYFPPKPEKIGSGSVWVYASDESRPFQFFSKPGEDPTWVKDEPYMIKPGNDVTKIHLILASRSEAVKGFEPRIVDLDFKDGEVVMQGEISSARGGD